MNDQEKFTLTSAQARQAYTTWYLNEGASSIFELLDPLIIPDYFPDFPEYANYIPRALQDDDLELKVMLWPNSAIEEDEEDTLKVYVRRRGESSWGTPTDIHSFPGPVDPDDFVNGYPVTVSANAFSAEGEYELMYTVEIFTGDITESVISTLHIDKTPPNDNQGSETPLEFRDQTPKEQGLTQAYLDSVSGTGVPLRVPGYIGPRNQDAVEIYAIFEGEIVEVKVFDGVIPNDRIVSILVNVFAGRPDGLLAFKFKLKDIVGNIGPFSVPLQTDLLLLPLPAGPFSPLRVPLAEDTGTLIDLADVRAGVRALVPLYTNHGKRDRIYVTWGTQTASIPHVVGENPANEIIIDISDSELINPDYGDSTGQKPTAVTYQIRRGSNSYNADSALDINVDLSQVIDPSILPAVLVRGGGSTPEDNKLAIGDVGFPATATFTVPNGLVGVDWARLYWGDLPDYVVEISPVPTPGTDVVFTIPWSDIEQVPGILIDVRYEVGITGDNNPSASPVTQVNVEEAVPVRLAVPEFLDARFVSNLWRINCTSWIGAEANLRLRIPPNPRLSAGQAMSIKVQGYSNFPPASTVGTPWTMTIASLSQSQVEEGFTVQVGPRADYFQDLLGVRGALKVDYNVGTFAGTLSIRAASQNAGGLCPINP
jgi:hypothetical protein